MLGIQLKQVKGDRHITRKINEMKQNTRTFVSVIGLFVLLTAGFIGVLETKPSFEAKPMDEWNVNGLKWRHAELDESVNYILLDFDFDYSNEIVEVKPIAFYSDPDEEVVFGVFSEERILTAYMFEEIKGDLLGVIIYGITVDGHEIVLGTYTRNDILEFRV